MTRIRFAVPGKPLAQGSKQAAVSKAGKPYLRDDNATKLRSWRNAVAAKAMEAMAGQPLLDGPVRVRVVFGMPRPLSHYNKAGLKEAAPIWCTTRPDVDKLQRALFDALKDVVWHDDSQVVGVVAQKPYADPPVTEVEVILSNPLDKIRRVC